MPAHSRPLGLLARWLVSVFSLGLHLLTWLADAVGGFLLLMLNDLISKKALEPTYTIGVGGSWFSGDTPPSSFLSVIAC